MNDSASTRSASSSWRQQCRRLVADCRTLVEARWRLATIECRIAARQIGRLGLVWAIALAALLVSATLALVALADVLEQLSGTSRTVWLCLMSAGLAVLAVIACWVAWIRFRRQFVGLQESLEELHEDIVWLREWLAPDDDDSPSSAAPPDSD